jgi:hypothetical protein
MNLRGLAETEREAMPTAHRTDPDRRTRRHMERGYSYFGVAMHDRGAEARLASRAP